jgi:hypothetical protein
VFYDPGSFGSTIEYVLHNYTNHPQKINARIMPDGSMHSFDKEYHVMNMDQLREFLDQALNPSGITTPGLTYCEFKLPQLLEYFSTVTSWATDHKIVVYQPNLHAAELNLLFKYYKMWLPLSLDAMYGDHIDNWKKWNSHCKHWSDLEPWQAREWFSLFYPGSVQEFIDCPKHVDDSWLIMSNTDILYDTVASLERIISFCELELQGDLNSFVEEWQAAQTYIVNEFELIDTIVDFTVNSKNFTWSSLCFVSEAIVQKRLRDRGYEIQCQDLNRFPTDTMQLATLLEKKNHA